MKIKIVLALIFRLSFFEIYSQSIAQESFNSTPVTLHSYDGGVGWTGNWYNQNFDTEPNSFAISNANPMIHSDEPDPGSYCHSDGTYVSTGRYLNASGAFADFRTGGDGTRIGVGTLYFSFLIRKEADDDNAVEVILSSADSEPWSHSQELIEVGYFGMASNDISGTRYWSLAAFNEIALDQSDSAIVIGRTYQIIVEVAFGATTIINMWVNPEDGTPDFSTPDASVSSMEDLSFWNVALFFDNTPASFDEFIFSEDVGTVLPVKYGAFSADKRDNMVELKWSTITEISNDHFIVHRSGKGNLWHPIGRISGKGDSNEVIDYSFLDHSPLEGVNYYRLKQVDYDGESHMSGIISVNFSMDMSKEVIIYQNDNEIEFQSKEVIKELLIFDLQGSLITHLFPSTNLFSIELGGDKAMYVAVIHTGSKIWKQKFLAR